MSYIGNAPTSIAFLTDTFSGDGTTVGYTMTVAPANTSSIIVAVTGVLQDPSTYSVSGTTLTFSAAPPSGTSNISVRYLGIPASGVTTTAYRTVTNFTATAGQTSFSVPSYTVGYIDVYRNGVRLVNNGTDFVATTGTTVVLNNACTVGDSVVTESFLVSSVLNAIPATAGAVNSTYIAAGAVGTTQIAASTTLTTPKVTTTIGVGNATPSGSGSGITFPATQSASSDANTLDDYEEGTWTPTDNSGAGLSFTSVSATYTKVGRLVNCLCQLIYPTTANAAAANIAGLPFTSANTQANRSGGVMTISTTAAVQRVYPAINDTTFPLLSGTGAGVTNATCSGAQFNFCITYYT
jgi:hypothetical protein